TAVVTGIEVAGLEKRPWGRVVVQGILEVEPRLLEQDESHSQRQRQADENEDPLPLGSSGPIRPHAHAFLSTPPAVPEAPARSPKARPSPETASDRPPPAFQPDRPRF